LLNALREVHRGQRSLSPQIQTKLNDDANLRSQTVQVPLRRSTLTLREREVMKLLAEGNTVKKAAAVLGVSVKTVEAHKFNLMRKLDIHNKAQLVTVAIQKKILAMLVPRRLEPRQSRDGPTSGSPTPSRCPATAPVLHRDRRSARRAAVDPEKSQACARPSGNY